MKKKSNFEEEEYILKPNGKSIFLTIIFSMLSIFGWIMLLKYNTNNFILSIYQLFTLFWIIISSWIASFLSYYSKRDRMTKMTYYIIVSLTIIYELTIVYAYFR